MVVLNLSQLQCCVFRWHVLISILMYTMSRRTNATDMENEITSRSVCQPVWDASDTCCHLVLSYRSFHLYLGPAVCVLFRFVVLSFRSQRTCVFSSLFFRCVSEEVTDISISR